MTMAIHLLLRLEAPMLSFGSVAVDQRRPIQRWPATSMLTGLLGNALGYRRSEPAFLDGLQQRLLWAVRVDRPGVPFTDFQTASLDKDDKGWTHSGRIEERAGGAATYDAPHIRWRDYRADASIAVALRLADADRPPTVSEIARALERPARPLFIGRKNCLPSQRVLAGQVEAEDAIAALAALPPAADATPWPAIFFHSGAADARTMTDERLQAHRTAGERRFALDIHAGVQTVYELLPWRPQADADDATPSARNGVGP